MIRRYYTVSRVGQNARLRAYVETSHYTADDLVIEHIVRESECVIPLDLLGAHMQACGINEFSTEEDMEMLTSIFPKEKKQNDQRRSH